MRMRHGKGWGRESECLGFGNITLEGRSHWASGKMAQQVKVLVTKPDELSLIPRSCVVEGRTNLEGCSQVSTCVVTHTYTHAKSNILFF